MLSPVLNWSDKRLKARAVGAELARAYGPKRWYAPDEVQACACRLGYSPEWQSWALQRYARTGKRPGALSSLFDADFLS